MFVKENRLSTNKIIHFNLKYSPFQPPSPSKTNKINQLVSTNCLSVGVKHYKDQ